MIYKGQYNSIFYSNTSILSSYVTADILQFTYTNNPLVNPLVNVGTVVMTISGNTQFPVLTGTMTQVTFNPVLSTISSTISINNAIKALSAYGQSLSATLISPYLTFTNLALTFYYT